MNRAESIIVMYVFPRVFTESKPVEKRYVVSIAGVSDKPSKLMRPQVWEMPCNTKEEAQSTLDEYQKKLQASGSKSFMVFLMPKIKAQKSNE